MQLPLLPKKSAGQSARQSAVMSRVDGVIRSFVRRFEDRLMEIYLRGGAASRIMKRVKTILDSTPSPRELEDLYSRRALYTDRKARERLGYCPKYDLEKGLQMSAVWLAQNGYIEAPERILENALEPVRRRPQQPIERPEPVAASHS